MSTIPSYLDTSVQECSQIHIPANTKEFQDCVVWVLHASSLETRYLFFRLFKWLYSFYTENKSIYKGCSNMYTEIIMHPGSPGNPSWYHFNVIILKKKSFCTTCALPESPFLKPYRHWECLHIAHASWFETWKEYLAEIARANFTFYHCIFKDLKAYRSLILFL